MTRIDAHQHFWKYDAKVHAWMTDEMEFIKSDFQPGDLFAHLTAHGIDGTVLVQVAQNDQETEYVLKIAEEHEFVKGVVGWVDLFSEHINVKLREYSKRKSSRGFDTFCKVRRPRLCCNRIFLEGSQLCRNLTSLMTS